DPLLDAPQVGGLAGEGGACDAGQGGELGGVVAAEVAVEGAVGVEAPGLADDLDGDDLGVGELRRGATRAESAEVQGFPFVIDETEYHEQELLRGHGGPPFDQPGGTVDLARTAGPFPA